MQCRFLISRKDIVLAVSDVDSVLNSKMKKYRLHGFYDELDGLQKWRYRIRHFAANRSFHAKFFHWMTVEKFSSSPVKLEMSFSALNVICIY
jgi:hypothetical protein